MSDNYLLLTPVLTFLVVLLVGFVGCGKLLPQDSPTEELPPRKQPEPPKEDPPKEPPPVVPETYSDIVQKTPGFVALWLLNETSGNVAKVEGLLNPAANGVYSVVSGGMTGSGYKLGEPGVMVPKDAMDKAPEFDATGAFIEVPFNAVLNPDPSAPGFTIELWAKPAPTLGSDRHVVISSHQFESPQKQRGYEIGLLKVAGQTHQQVYARVYSSTGATMSEITVQPLQGAVDEWRHIVLRYSWDGTKGSISMRVQLKTGELYAANPIDAAYEQVTLTNKETLRFAANHSTGGVAVAAGRLDNIAIYNALLPDSALDDHFKFIV